MVEMKTYSEVDLFLDPIICLPCNHFFTISTLDGLYEMHSAYNQELIDGVVRWTSVKPVDTAKTKTCPSCRSVIHSVFRYGRMLKTAELKILERKHAMDIDARMRSVEGLDQDKRLDALIAVLNLVKKGPTLKVCQLSGYELNCSWLQSCMLQ